MSQYFNNFGMNLIEVCTATGSWNNQGSDKFHRQANLSAKTISKYDAVQAIGKTMIESGVFDVPAKISG